MEQSSALTGNLEPDPAGLQAGRYDAIKVPESWAPCSFSVIAGLCGDSRSEYEDEMSNRALAHTMVTIRSNR
ncbi:unnamed protein product [Darwinula stevensoni]|uniref:Uncharacterized protein n=1 Tax=Darwinula stevensoni TaxID=69355 RepID=A0A7R8X730_9CRUS|nr:unnamed protein product [Darwinula stevensoni]CAG0880080.1 unnamed protein product [Darwinula stevensoni]